MYIMYKEKRPDKMLAEGSPFYIGINKKSKGGAWYVSQPMGKKHTWKHCEVDV